MDAVLPWQLVRVEGYSMTPTLLPGDWLLVRHGGRVRPGSVAVARFRSRPELLVVKRVAEPSGDGWLLASDNPTGGSDSRTYGVADVDAVAIRCWPRSPIRSSRHGRYVGRRIGRDRPVG
jgi:phage repressor protein C with HTH and peptisase S24 domain